ALLLPQIFELCGARLARLTLAHSGLSGVQWLALLILALSSLVILALVHNNEPGHQALAMSLYAVATAATFFVILSALNRSCRWRPRQMPLALASSARHWMPSSSARL